MLFFDDLANVKKIQEFWTAQHHMYVYTKESNESDCYCPKERYIKITRKGLKNPYKKKEKDSSNDYISKKSNNDYISKKSNHINEYISKKSLEIGRDKRSSNFYPNKSRPF